MAPKKRSKAHKDSRETRSQVAARIYSERRMRSEHFHHHNLFREPAWDILLHLYQGHLRGRGMKIDSVSLAVGLPATSALRWLEVLEGKGLVFAYRDEGDADQIFLRLSKRGLSEMAEYLDRIALSDVTSGASLR